MTGPLAVALPAEAVEALVEQVVDRVLERLERSPAAEPAPASPYMTVPEAAEYLRTSRQRVDDLLSQRRLTRVKEGRRTLIRRKEVEIFLARGCS
jgi:excisionase family DNA binding protein